MLIKLLGQNGLRSFASLKTARHSGEGPEPQEPEIATFRNKYNHIEGFECRAVYNHFGTFETCTRGGKV